MSEYLGENHVKFEVDKETWKMRFQWVDFQTYFDGEEHKEIVDVVITVLEAESNPDDPKKPKKVYFNMRPHKGDR